MRHRKKGRKLSRSPSHRQAMRRNMASSLFRHERIFTTVAKAKEVQRFAERLITLARRALPYRDTDDPADRAKYLHYYRMALGRLQDKEMVQKLFGEGEWREQECLAERYANRPGGYTRIVRLSGSRLGIPIGTAVAEIPEFTYEINGRERTLKLTGNRLGDNAPQALFELVEKEAGRAEEEELAPAVDLSGPADEESADEASSGEEDADEDAEE